MASYITQIRVSARLTDITSVFLLSTPYLRRYLNQSRGSEATEAAFKRVNDVFWYSLQAVQDKIINDKHCFELYGYDVLFDVDLRCWLIEVNASPSLSASRFVFLLIYGLNFALISAMKTSS